MKREPLADLFRHLNSKTYYRYTLLCLVLYLCFEVVFLLSLIRILDCEFFCEENMKFKFENWQLCSTGK